MSSRRTTGLNVGSKERRALKARLLTEQNQRCCTCGVRMEDSGGETAPNYPTFEHVYRWASGGTNTYENLVLTCVRCNQADVADAVWSAYCIENGTERFSHLHEAYIAPVVDVPDWKVRLANVASFIITKESVDLK